MKTRNYIGRLAGIAGILVLLASSCSVSAADKKETKKEPTLQERIVSIVDEYVGIHGALAGDTAEHVNHHAMAIVKSADAALELAKKDEKKNKKLTEALIQVKMSADKLTGDKNTLKDAREKFYALSDAVIEIAKNHLPGEAAGKYYTFYCPMAKGYWIQADKKTSNPYFGKDMLTCGKSIDYAKECGKCEGKCACDKEKGKCGCAFKGSEKGGMKHDMGDMHKMDMH